MVAGGVYGTKQFFQDDTDKIIIDYQNIVDNVKLLDDETLKHINEIIVQMGHDV